MLTISYNNTIEEETAAYGYMYNKYKLWRFFTGVGAYVLVDCIGINIMMHNLSDISGWGLTLVSTAMIIIQIVNLVMVKHKLSKKLRNAPDEEYEARFKTDVIEVDIKQKQDGELQTVETMEIGLSEDINFDERKDFYMMTVNKRTLCVFPKRCLSDVQQKELTEYFHGKAI